MTAGVVAVRGMKSVRLSSGTGSARCARQAANPASMFGSALRDDFRPASDLDLRVEFDPDHVFGLAFFTMQDALSELFGRQMDLNTPECLSPYFRKEVLREVEEIHVAK